MDINPYGWERVPKGDWERFIGEIEGELRQRGLSFQEKGSGIEIWEIWNNVREKMNQERRGLSLRRADVKVEQQGIEVLEKNTVEEIIRD